MMFISAPIKLIGMMNRKIIIFSIVLIEYKDSYTDRA